MHAPDIDSPKISAHIFEGLLVTWLRTRICSHGFCFVPFEKLKPNSGWALCNRDNMRQDQMSFERPTIGAGMWEQCSSTHDQT